MNTIYLLLGGNEGDTRKLFSKATLLLGEQIGEIKEKSAIYRSSSWGFDSNNDFLNQLLILQTKLHPDELLHHCLQIEAKLGRMRNSGKGYTDRPIDIDILYFGAQIIKNESLIIPHPRLHERLFALIPLNEIIPDFIHPVLHKSNKSSLSLCSDKSKIEKLE